MTQPTRSATRPIPAELREPFYLAMWDLAWSGHFYRKTPGDSDEFLRRFGSGSIVARRHGLTILWQTALAGRFNELAKLEPRSVDGNVATMKRSKKGKQHSVDISPPVIDCTTAWHRRVGQLATTSTGKLKRWCEAMRDSKYLLPSVTGSHLNVNVFNRDVAGPLGKLFGCKLSSHCFRDTACQQAMLAVKDDANLDVRAVQALMGHRSIRTTEHYLQKERNGSICLSLFGGES